MAAYTKTSTEIEKTYDRTQNVDTTPYLNPAIHNNVFPSEPTAGITLRTVTKSMVGSTLPGWRNIIRNGSNATTDLTASATDLSCEPLRHQLRGSTVKDSKAWDYQRKQASWWSGGLTVPALPSASLRTKAINQAQTRFYKSLQSKTTLFDGGTFLGELGETLTMLRNPAKALRGRLDDYLSTAKKRRKGSQADQRKAVADTWLEYSFGWVPLLNDIDSAMSYLDKRAEQISKDFIQVSGSSTASETTDIFTSKAFNFMNARSNIRTTFTAYCRYKGAISVTALGGAGNLRMKSVGLHPSNFLPTVYNLLPWSFAIDYFSNLGDVISAYSTGRIGLAWGCETIRQVSNAQLIGITTSISGTLPTVWYQASSGGSGYSSRKQVNRVSITYVPLPDLQFEIPGMGTKWLNLAALATARIATSKR